MPSSSYLLFWKNTPKQTILLVSTQNISLCTGMWSTFCRKYVLLKAYFIWKVKRKRPKQTKKNPLNYHCSLDALLCPNNCGKSCLRDSYNFGSWSFLRGIIDHQTIVGRPKHITEYALRFDVSTLYIVHRPLLCLQRIINCSLLTLIFERIISMSAPVFYVVHIPYTTCSVMFAVVHVLMMQ